jgi:hypothetical protein
MRYFVDRHLIDQVIDMTYGRRTIWSTKKSVLKQGMLLGRLQI